MKKLKKILPSGSKARKKKSLKALAKAAKEFVSEKEEVWAPFSKQRLRPLEILQELTAIINKKKFDVKIEQVSISGDDQDASPIELQGVFRSKTGSDHFTQFSDLEVDIRNSKILVLTDEIDPTPAEGSILFTARFKHKDV